MPDCKPLIFLISYPFVLCRFRHNCGVCVCQFATPLYVGVYPIGYAAIPGVRVRVCARSRVRVRRACARVRACARACACERARPPVCARVAW